mgnify:CR=1 FL=1
MSLFQPAILLLLLPLASAAVIALFLRKRGELASWVSVGAAAGIAAIALTLWRQGAHVTASREWLHLGGLTISLGVKVDDLALLMLFVVGFVGFLIHVRSEEHTSELQSH